MLRRLALRVLRLRLSLLAGVRTEMYSTMLWAVLIGVLGALSSIAFRTCVEGPSFLRTGRTSDLVALARSLPWWGRALLPAVGGLAAGLVLHFGTRVLKGQRSPEYLEAIALGDGNLKARATLVRTASAALSIASGSSIGREGPLVQLASLVGSLLGRVRGLPIPRRRLLVACGAAAGIASAYNAPISGALFVAEIVFGTLALESLGPLILSSVTASLTLRYSLGANPLFRVEGFRIESVWELGAYVVLGLLAGSAAPWFLRALRGSERAFRLLPGPTWIRLTLGGVLVGVLSIAVPEVWGNGYSVVESLLRQDWEWKVLVAVAVFKLAATTASVGSGAVGGVFTPTLFFGAAIGSGLGLALQRLGSNATGGPQAYALVGMGSFLAATTHAPLTAILLVFEMTLEYSIVIPLTIACVIAYAVAYGIDKRSIYSRSLGSRSRAAALASVTVRELMKPEPTKVLAKASLSEVAAQFARSSQEFLFVVSAEGRFQGAIPLRALGPWLSDPDLQSLAIADDLLQSDFPTVQPETDLKSMLELFAHHRGNRLAVVEGEGSSRAGLLLGSVSKTDVLLALAHGIGDQPSE